MSTAVLDRPLGPVVTPAPPEPPQRRLSDLLRWGAQETPQAFGMVHNPLSGATCALGAIVISLGGPKIGPWSELDWGGSISAWISRQTGINLSKRVLCPTTGEEEPLVNCIVYLNDHWRLPREEIADWLEEQGL